MKRLLYIMILCACASGVKAQQVHFSQFYNNPLLLNPALCGFNECIMRAGGTYRDQWRIVSKPYQTYDFFLDTRIHPYTLRHNWFGLGLQFTGDQAGTSKMKTNDIRLIFSFHQGFIRKNELVISFGLSGSYVSKSMDFSGLTFGTQWTGSGFDPGLWNYEPARNTSTGYFDANAGLLITYMPRYEYNFHLGASVDHLTFPRYSFVDGRNQVWWRMLVHAGSNIVLSRKTNLMPKAYFSMQNATYEMMLGTNLSYKPRLDPFFFGLWYRWNRDIIPLFGYGLRGFNVMFSFDVNISRFRRATSLIGGFEISLVKVFLCDPKYFKKKDQRYRKTGRTNCPIF